MSFNGIIFRFVYRLRHHWWIEWPLSRWFGLLLVIAGAVALVYWRVSLVPAILIGLLYLGYLALLAWVERQGFVRFEPAPHNSLLDVEPASPLRANQMVPVRASGWFSVEGETKYYVSLDADFETVGTREHIILARVHPSRFLLIGKWPSFEHGWWYIFFQPAMIQELTLGHLHFGTQPQLTLRIVYAPDEKEVQTVYLTADNVSVLRRIWDDILLDAPAGVTIDEQS